MVQTVKSACSLQENALEIRVSDQVEQLDELIHAQGDGSSFFERTHVTQGMQTLIVEGIARLAGKSTQGIFHLKQAMGGGKTHLLIGFGLLAKHHDLRKKYGSYANYWDGFQSASVAAFNGRNSPETFFWGEIASQLGKAEFFRNFWVGGPKAPDEKDWLDLFNGGEPILILLDEMPPYFHYLDTQKVGNGTVADIATRAFANLLTAAGKKSNVCVVISDLAAAYDTGGRLINRSLEDARQELGRQERNITPVDLEGNEIYDILRKRLFKRIDRAVMNDVAARYGQLLEEATKAKVASRAAEAIADEIANTYPFHPRLKNLIALFKENEKFKQTRGLLELISRLLKSVWERPGDDVFLIGAQHFDLSIPDVREKLAEISEMRDVIARDIWDSNHSAHAQVIDSQTGGNAGQQVATIMLTASLSMAVNAVKGLTKEELVECLLSPFHTPTDFLSAMESLETTAWYLHRTPEGRHYFDRQENLTKLLQSLADNAPDNKVNDLICKQLFDMFKPVRKSVYDEVLPLPTLDDVVGRVRKSRVLLIVDPDSKMPPDEVKKFFDSLTEKNNLCVLTGDKSVASIEKAARQVFASEQAKTRIPENHPQRTDLEDKVGKYKLEFTSAILNVFDKVLFPIQRPGNVHELSHRVLEITRDQSKPFMGEDQIEQTLVKSPTKLYLDVEKYFDVLKEKAETILWPEGQNDARWSDIEERAESRPAMPWMVPSGLSQLKVMACNRGLWEDLGNGFLTKKPKKKKTSVQVQVEAQMDDEGYVRLGLNALNAGPIPRIHYAEDGRVSEASSTLTDQSLRTKALRVQFLAVDPTGQYEAGDPVIWATDLVIRNQLYKTGEFRQVSLHVAPRADVVRYTLDGTEPREGIVYSDPIPIGPEKVEMLVFAECAGVEKKDRFSFPELGRTGPDIDDTKPATWIGARSGKKLDSTQKVFEGLTVAKQSNVQFEGVTINVGQGSKIANLTIGDIPVPAEYVESLLTSVLDVFEDGVPIVLIFRKAQFGSGYDLKQYATKLGLRIDEGEVVQ